MSTTACRKLGSSRSGPAARNEPGATRRSMGGPEPSVRNRAFARRFRGRACGATRRGAGRERGGVRSRCGGRHAMGRPARGTVGSTVPARISSGNLKTADTLRGVAGFRESRRRAGGVLSRVPGRGGEKEQQQKQPLVGGRQSSKPAHTRRGCGG